MGEKDKRKRAITRATGRGTAPRGLVARGLLALLMVLAPALNLAAPMAPRESVPLASAMQDMARADATTAPSQPCTHANVVTSSDDKGCGAGDHADTAHHPDPHCLQCIAFGSPGLPGAPDIATIVPISVAASAYPNSPDSPAASRDVAAYFSRGPPPAV